MLFQHRPDHVPAQQETTEGIRSGDLRVRR
jgi:hypothetical protein